MNLFVVVVQVFVARSLCLLLIAAVAVVVVLACVFRIPDVPVALFALVNAIAICVICYFRCGMQRYQKHIFDD